MSIKSHWALPAALVALFLLLGAAGCGEAESQASANGKAAQLVKVGIETVKAEPLKDVLALPGVAEARKEVKLAADWAGKVEWICECEGTQVKKGDLVAKVDTASLSAVLQRAEAAYKLADELAQRRSALFKKKVLPREELDRALTERIVAEGNLREARVNYQRGFVRSPIDGLVNYIHLEVGEFVDRGQPVADLVNVRQIRIRVSVPEMDVRFLKVGQQALVMVDAFPGRKLIGAIDLVSYKGDEATKTFLVRVTVDNADRSIRSGMIARVFFLRRLIPDAISVPLSSIVDKGGERLIFVEKDGVAHARIIKIGVIQEDRVQITEGLQAGDHLIVVGQHEVEEGTKVSVQ